MPDTLYRFLEAQEKKYKDAFDEIERGKKESHWMWYIFPQIAGLGHSETAKYYAINDPEEAQAYLNHPILGQRLKDISRLLLEITGKSAYDIFGKPDNLKLNSCMTLFSSLKDPDPVFQQVIDKYFDGQKDNRTLEIISQSPAR